MLIWHDGSSRNEECAPIDLFIRVTIHSVRSFSLLLLGPANPRSLAGLQLFSPVASICALSVIFLVSGTADCSPVF